ncbi:hypothetical protein BD779DRAFT_1484993 [Infundibulicybe gibba]|nr:hypothetical protein BD779DRAFT_1484993 [Infundibulicybe gibba]
MKPRDYCCCAIPLVNAGIYATLISQFVSALLVGILSVSTPSLVGAATPSFAPWILAIICLVGAGVQVLGFVGVAKEKPILFRRYVSLHSLLALAAFAVAAAWAIISASRHSVAQANCLQDFFSQDQQSEGETLCNIFPWVDVGIMGGLWVVLAIFHIYLYLVLLGYGSSQRRDHAKYDQLADPTNINNNIPMHNRNDPWDSRPSTESNHTPPSSTPKGYGHLRQESVASVADIMSQPHQTAHDTFSNSDYRYNGSYPPQSNISRQVSDGRRAIPDYNQSYEHNDSFYGEPKGNVDPIGARHNSTRR